MDSLYMAVTDDDYELPIAVTSTVVEMARLFRLSPNTISSQINYNLKRENDNTKAKRQRPHKFIKVELTD